MRIVRIVRKVRRGNLIELGGNIAIIVIMVNNSD